MNGAVHDLITWSCSKNNLCILEGSRGGTSHANVCVSRGFSTWYLPSHSFEIQVNPPHLASMKEGPPLAFFLDGSPSENLTYAFYDLVQHSLCLMDKSVGILESVCDVKATDPRNISLVIDHGLESLVDVR